MDLSSIQAGLASPRGERTGMRKSIPKDTLDLGIRPGPRAVYQATCQEPDQPADPDIMKDTPLRLLVVNLSGTLVFRNKQKSRNRSINAKARPFMRALLRYCLGHEKDRTPAIRCLWAIPRAKALIPRVQPVSCPQARRLPAFLLSMPPTSTTLGLHIVLTKYSSGPKLWSITWKQC